MNKIQWDYVDEGNANVIYWSPSVERLLRVPKHLSAEKIYEFHLRQVAPRLGPLATHMVLESNLGLLVEPACPWELLAQCPIARKCFPVACRWAELSSGPHVAIEFKPKWLIQSPRAPANARSCRTCAMNRQRGRTGFCPLVLGSSEPDTAVQSILRAASIALAPHDLHRYNLNPVLCAYLINNRPFEGLRQMQALDVPGASPDDLALAMTARDCSVMLTVKLTPDPEICIKFLDLDPKSNVQSWTRKETALDYYQVNPACMLSSNI